VKHSILKIAHRGASQCEPENTLRAFRRAIELGADMIEIDVHLSRDGIPVILHDFQLDRMTDGHGPVSDKSLTELKTLTVAGVETIPTLAETIDLVRGQCGLYIELKGEGTPGPTVETLRGEGFTSEVIVGSFRPWLVSETKALAPEIRTSILTGELGADYVALARSVNADYVHLCWERAAPQPHRLLTPDLIATLRSASLGIVLWHEERPEEIRELLKLDVDGICSNAPDLLAREGYE
jgi:glycerophosphoryl diester phosphodiesterase